MLIWIAELLVLKIADVLDRVVPVLGWEMKYDSIYDCFDWLIHLLTNIGLFLTDRCIVNNRVIISAKKRTVTDYVLAAGLFCYLFIYMIYFIKKFWKQDMLLYEIVFFMFFICFIIFGEFTIIFFSSFGETLEQIGKLQCDADIAMKMIKLSLNYRFVIIPLIFVLVFSYQIIAVTSVQVFFTCQANNSTYIFTFFSTTVVYLVLMLSMSFMFQFGGHPYVCCVRLITLNNYIQKEIDAGDAYYDHVICGNQELDWEFNTQHTSELDLQAIADILFNQHELMKLHKKITSLLIFYFLHIYVLMMALYIYLHFNDYVISYAAMWVFSSLTAVFLLISSVIELYKRQTKYTIELITEWNVCYFDPAMIQSRNIILLQATHLVYEPVLAGAIPIDTSLMITVHYNHYEGHAVIIEKKKHGEHTTVGPPLPLSKLLHMSIPPSHTALSGDLHVQVHGTWPSDASTLQLRLSRLDGAATHQLYAAAARPDARALGNATTHGNSTGTTVLRLPCGLFSKGGEYYVELVRTEGNKSQEEEEEEDKVAKGLDVRWPLPRLSLTPEHVPTYPELPVTAILEFPEVMCPPVADAAPAAIPEFWLELHYCGHSLLTCDHHNQTHSPQVLYSEQIRGFPGRRMVTLRCELFGLAGHYALLLRPTTPMPSLSNTAAYVKADWSEQFVFNVHARSILPCDVHSGGIPVLFQYPSCILSAGDRVRLFARLRADVGSLAPPTSLEYVAERRVVRGQHSLHFDCELFSERYVEYCFVYVSQAITGAVADVRMDCVPTLPVSESESGGWGAWSAWTPCSSTCAGGTRNRYRFCDSPPPRYGAKFCEGNAVETEKCGGSNDLVAGTDWDCMYSGGDSGSAAAPGDISPADRPEVLAEVGPGCRCGCVVHLGHAKPRRLLATSSHSCPGRTFWLIQADVDHAVRFKVDHYRLPCGSQWLKVRDGSSLSATLLAQLSGGGERRPTAPAAVQSTGQHLLLEFFSDELMAGGEACGGGFLAHAMQIRLVESNTTLTSSASASTSSVAIASSTRLTAYHAAALLLASVVLVATALLAAQYVLRYRKYTLAEDLDSLAESGAGTDTGVALRTRAASSTTLLSEVISLTRLRPPRRHTRLRESMDVGDVEMETREQGEALCSERTDEHPEGGSHCSTLTLTPEDRAVTPALSTRSAAASVSTKERSAPASPTSLRSATSAIPITAFTQPPALLLRRHRRPSLVTSPVAALTNGCYSPAASIISTATIRSMNAKESKEKRNRERLLTGPVGSEFSLANTDIDLELDYYDYNVVNAGAVPGSYLGMDPQYLVWIPPLDEGGEILENLDKLPYEFEDIRPKQYIDPGSNQESPEEEVLIPKQRRRSISECNSKQSPVIISKRVHPLKLDTTDASDVNVAKELSPLLKRVDSSRCAIPLHEFPKRLGLNSPAKVHRPSEKETKVEKSPSQKSYDLDDIKFADDECEEEAGDTSDVADVQCNKKPYQDSNIITSS